MITTHVLLNISLDHGQHENSAAILGSITAAWSGLLGIDDHLDPEDMFALVQREDWEAVDQMIEDLIEEINDALRADELDLAFGFHENSLVLANSAWWAES
jgi:hypothetical protein